MTSTNAQRRRLLQAAAGIASASPLGLAIANPAPPSPTPSGKAGDFDFLSGEWKIKNRRLQDGKWIAFEGEATVVAILGGIASMEELRIPAQRFSGMGLRLLDVKRQLWADYWCNGNSGALNPATWGSFNNGVGIWDSADTEDGKAIIVRGVWDQITPASCRWYQAVSRDAGATWAENWVMHWQRVKPAA